MVLPFKKEKGVSPVIATILMVAITVVLAATVYIMVIGINPGSQRLSSGNLVYKGDLSEPHQGKVVFELVANFPQAPKVENVHIKLIDTSGNVVPEGEYTISWTHIGSKDENHITGGDLLTINMPNTDLSGYNVILYVDGYSGTIKGRVP